MTKTLDTLMTDRTRPLLNNPPLADAEQARALICVLGKHFYDLGWVTGTGGGISLRVGDTILMAPSGVQKEAIDPRSIYALSRAGDVISGPPPSAGFKLSECAPLFFHAFDLREAGAVMHSHSHAALLATLVFDDVFRVTQLEMMKGITGTSYNDILEVPIIENTAHECDLADSLKAAMLAYPRSHAVLVRRHGVYIWGTDWRQAKKHAECYDYLFHTAVEMKRLGFDPARPLQTANESTR